MTFFATNIFGFKLACLNLGLRLRALSCLTLAGLGIGFSGCQSLREPPDPHVLQVGNEAEPATLDPHQATGQPELRLLGSLVEGLVVRTAIPGVVEPGLARSWQMDSSGTRYTFHLRPSFWSDGSPFKAKHLVDSWRRFADPKTAAEYASLLKPVRHGDAVRLGKQPPDSLGIEALDDSTLLVTLEQPTAFFLDLCAFEPFAPTPIDTIKKHGPGWTHAGRFTGTGPFRLIFWKSNQRAIVERNPHYWDSAKVSLRQIHFRAIEDQLTAFQMARNFELDWVMNVPKNRLVQARTLPEYFSAPLYGTYYFLVNCKKQGYDKPALRKALALAIDRQRIVDRVLRGAGIAAKSFVPGTEPYPELDKLRFDTAEAREALRASGFGPNSPPPDLQILFNNSEQHKMIAEVVQQMWLQTLGLKAELVNYEWKVYLENTKNLNYASTARASWIGDFSDPISFLELFTSNNLNNRAGYANPRYDSLIESSWEEPDAKKRLDILRQAEDLLMDELPIIPVYHYAVTEMRSPRLRGASPSPLGMYAWKHLSLEGGP
jgi:oligopeptide transport system substrate-binding protein